METRRQLTDRDLVVLGIVPGEGELDALDEVAAMNRQAERGQVRVQPTLEDEANKFSDYQTKVDLGLAF